MSFWKPTVNVTVECVHPDRTVPEPPEDRRKLLAWIEPDGTLVLTKRFTDVFNQPVTGWDTPPELTGMVLERDPSMRAWKYVPETLSEKRAAEIIGKHINEWSEMP